MTQKRDRGLLCEPIAAEFDHRADQPESGSRCSGNCEQYPGDIAISWGADERYPLSLRNHESARASQWLVGSFAAASARPRAHYREGMPCDNGPSTVYNFRSATPCVRTMLELEPRHVRALVLCARVPCIASCTRFCTQCGFRHNVFFSTHCANMQRTQSQRLTSHRLRL